MRALTNQKILTLVLALFVQRLTFCVSAPQLKHFELFSVKTSFTKTKFMEMCGNIIRGVNIVPNGKLVEQILQFMKDALFYATEGV